MTVPVEGGEMQAYIVINAFASILIAYYAERHRRSFWKYYFLSVVFSAVLVWAYLLITIAKSKKQ